MQLYDVPKDIQEILTNFREFLERNSKETSGLTYVFKLLLISSGGILQFSVGISKIFIKFYETLWRSKGNPKNSNKCTFYKKDNILYSGKTNKNSTPDL